MIKIPRFAGQDTQTNGIRLDSNLTGQLLIAAPDMSDSRFSKAVILIAAYDIDGAAGFVLNNRHATHRLPSLMESIELMPSDMNVHPKANMPVYNGGPMETGRGFLIHSQDAMPVGSIPIGDICAVSGSQEILLSLAKGQGALKNFFCLGYAGWEKGQLEQELKENAWLVCPATETLIFECERENLWQASLSQMGVQASALFPAGTLKIYSDACASDFGASGSRRTNCRSSDRMAFLKLASSVPARRSPIGRLTERGLTCLPFLWTS